MIFRLTQKLAKKIGETPTSCLPPDVNPFADWTGHLFTVERVQYIILTNTPSLYSIVFPGRGVTGHNSFLRESFSYMHDFMAGDGNEFFFRRFIEPRMNEVSFSKSGDRSVLGSMNELILQTKYYLRSRGLSPFEAATHVNESPMSYLGHQHPAKAFRNLKIREVNAAVV
ncbi:MAG: hypothetical protein HY788_21655 [Deltaproteobacteria bacterium]|nr:hypothetical protein [Deltaproteobacteria bacterium]